MKHLRYLNKYFLKYKWRFLLGILFVAGSNLLAVVVPIIVRHAFDLVESNLRFYQTYEDFSLQGTFFGIIAQSVLVFGLIILGLTLIRGLLMFFMRQTLIVMSRLIEYDLRNEMYAHYQKLDQAFYKRNNTGDLMSRVAEDVNRVRMYLGPGVMYTINTVVLFAMVIIVMFSVNAELSLYVLMPMPVMALAIYYVSHIINKRSENIQQQLSTLTTIAQEVYSGIRVIKSYVQEKTYGRYFGSQSEIYKDKSLKLARVEALFFPVMMLMIGLSTVLAIYVGGIQVMQGKITTGNIAEFVIYVTMLSWPVASVGWIASIVQRAAASQKRINEFLHTEPTILPNEGVRKPIAGRVEFRNVSFTYPDTGVKALQNVSFRLNPGEKMAIVGRTGSGKTTIADLLMRMYDPTEGAVLIDDVDVRERALLDMRSQMAYVPQDVFLFSDTVTRNIAFGMDGQQLNGSVEAMAKVAAIHDEIMSLPKGYETRIGERGVTLSGGQKQRISIARALLRDPALLILDDCLSAVDAATEQSILRHLNDALKNRTAIVITHRIFSLLDFDKVIVLDHGRLAEEGTHEQLLGRGGLYKAMYERQKLEERLA